MKFKRELLKNVEGYVPGEQPAVSGIIKLNTNENPYPPSPKVVEALHRIGEDGLRKYPNPVAYSLRSVCAERFGYPGPEWVVAGNGMDELLALALRTFTDPGDRVLTTYPTYTLYEVLCQLHGANCVHVELDDDFQLTPEFSSTDARLCFLTRPNAPSGVAFPKKSVEDFCNAFPGIVVIDEAYVDFCVDNCMDLPHRFNNVIVMRTFSKSFSMAGMRVGIAVAQPAIIDEFMKTKDSYNVNVFSQVAAEAAMRDYDWMLENTRKVCATRTRLRKELIGMGFDVPDSQTNFLLAQWNGAPSAREIFEDLRTEKILVRYFDARRLVNALRISIGTDKETDRLLEALDEMLPER